MPFTCPDCLMTSHHPDDEKNQYCGNCHEFKNTYLPPTVKTRKETK